MDRDNVGDGVDALVDATEEAPGVWAISIGGEIDITRIPRLSAVVDEVLATRPKRVVFDLRDVGFIDSSGLGVLLTTAAAVDDVRLRQPSRVVQRLVAVTGLTELLLTEQ